MPTPIQFQNQGLMPAKVGHLAVRVPVALPFGVAYSQGACLGLIGGSPTSAVLTLSMTLNGATGFKGYFTYISGDKTYNGLALGTAGLTANLSTAYPSAAQIQAALIATVPQWSGNVTVTGNAGGPYTITFNNLLANRRYGGTLTFTVTSSTGGVPTGSVATTTPGSIGAGQYDLYATGGTPNRVDAFLMYALALDPVGANTGPEFPSSSQATSGYPAWSKGIFFADQTNFPEKSVQTGTGAGLLDANAFTITPYKLTFEAGTSLSDAGCMVELV